MEKAGIDMTWEKERVGTKAVLNKPVLVVGLPGIGNVGKIAVDFLKEELKAKRLVSFWSDELPHTVFVNEKNLIELPRIELFHAKLSQQDVLFVVGDAQPVHEMACYNFCDELIKTVKEFGCNRIITLGGIALQHVPKKPQLYCIGADKKAVTDFVKGTQIKTELYGIVGPIIGVTGVLAGLAARRGLNAVILLAETFGHPMYLGIAGAREIVQVLTKKLKVSVDINALSKEIKQLEEETLLRRKNLQDMQQGALPTFHGKGAKETSYIG